MHSNGGRWHKSLTPKQEKFCLAYLATGNASEAYRRAYSASAMKAATVNRNAAALLRSNKIATRVAELRKPAIEKARLGLEQTLREVARLAYADPRRLFRSDGTLIPLHELDDDAAAMVASVEVDEIKTGGKVVGYTRKIKLWDKNSAIDKAMKHLGLFKEDNKQGAPSVVIIAATPADERL